MSAVTSFVYHTETIGGVEVQKPLPKRLHAIIQARIQRWLDQQCGEKFEVLPSLDVLCGNDRYVPDITVARVDAAYRNGMLDEGAYLAIEIMSPGQTIGNLFQKCETYLQHGTGICWVIWPKRRQAWIYTKHELWEVFAEKGNYLEATSPALSLEVPLQTLFADLPESE